MRNQDGSEAANHSSDSGFVAGLHLACERKKGTKDNCRIWSLFFNFILLQEGRSGAIFEHVTFESLLEITQVEMSREQPDKYLSVEFLGRWAGWSYQFGTCKCMVPFKARARIQSPRQENRHKS